MSASVVVQGGALLFNIDGLGNTSAEPVCFLVKYSYILVLELVLVFQEVLTHMRGRVPVFFEARV